MSEERVFRYNDLNQRSNLSDIRSMQNSSRLPVHTQTEHLNRFGRYVSIATLPGGAPANGHKA
jgi:hypothetical protein